MQNMSNKKELLIITFAPPYPATDGGKMSIYGTVNYLRKYFNITLVFKTFGNNQIEDVNILKGIWPDVKIVNVHYEINTLITEKRNVGFYIRHILHSLKKIIKYFLYKKDNANEVKDFASYSYKSNDYYPFQPNDLFFINSLENLFENNLYDLIQVEYSSLLNIIHILPESTQKIFVQIENRYKILEDYFKKNKDDSLFSEYIVQNARFTEMSLMNKYDYIFALSANDKIELEQFINSEKIYFSTFPILDSLHSNYNSEEFIPEKLVFLGSQNHSPNEDAMMWFIESIYPFVNLKLYITGKWESSFIKKFPNVVFTGFIDDLSELLRNSIVISPIRLGGGGVRAKVIQALAMKCPLISTSLSCEGLQSLEHKKNVFIADTIEEFYLGINELHLNKRLCRFLISNGYNLIQKFYSEKAVGDVRKEIYLKILANSREN